MSYRQDKSTIFFFKVSGRPFIYKGKTRKTENKFISNIYANMTGSKLYLKLLILIIPNRKTGAYLSLLAPVLDDHQHSYPNGTMRHFKIQDHVHPFNFSGGGKRIAGTFETRDGEVLFTIK